MDGLVFRFGKGSIPSLPLGRFLPPLPEGIISEWLSEKIPPGAWLLDPLGSTPQVALEAARSGYRVLVACNNPVLALMMEVLAAAPRRADFQAAISTLADSRRSGERLEIHLQSLYRTTCPVCGKQIQAREYLWKKNEPRPYARLIDCPVCKTSGEYSIEVQDHSALELPGNLQLLHSRALERIGIPYVAENPVVAEVVASYPERSFYALFNLINRIEALPVMEDKKNLLRALLLSVCDAGNMLWPHPQVTTRPRLITIPSEFREANLWLDLQNAVNEWIERGPEIEYTIYPEIPKGGSGICLFPGRLGGLGQLPVAINPQASLAVVPYPNQAFWSYSAVWSGWIWGKETAGALHGVLGRQRFDSRWVGAVLTAAFANLPHSIPFYAQIPEISPGLLMAVLAAGQAGGLKLEGAAFEQDSELAEIVWTTGYRNEIALPNSITHLLRDMMSDDLLERGEPATYLQLAGAALERIIHLGLLPAGSPRSFDDILTRISQGLKETFEDQAFFKVFGSRAPDSQGMWWFHKEPSITSSLADRVEKAVVEQLEQAETIVVSDIQKKLNGNFRGFFTPPTSLIEAVLISYGNLDSQKPGFYRLEREKSPQAFTSQLDDIGALIQKLGKKLKFDVVKKTIPRWEKDGKPAYLFFLTLDGCLSRWLEEFPHQGSTNFLVCPEIRQELLNFKINSNPHLQEAMGNWRILGFDQLRRIAANPDPLWALRDALSDPGKTPEGTEAQISFLS